MRYTWLTACLFIVTTISAGAASAGAIECNRQTALSPEDKKRAGALVAAMSKASPTFKSLDDDAKVLAFAQGIEAWRLLGREGLRDHMEISAFAGLGLRLGPKGLEKDPVLGKQLTDHAKAVAAFVMQRYQNRNNSTGANLKRPAVPANLPASPPEHAVRWARQVGGFPVAQADPREEAQTRYCDLLAKTRSGQPVGDEAAWAIAYEKSETDYAGDDTPPLWRAAMAEGEVARARAEAAQAKAEAARAEQARKTAAQSESRARQAKKQEERRKYAARLAEQAKNDRVLSRSETDALCQFYGDLCQRQLQIQRYQSCFFEASERAASYYSAARRSGMRPTDGTWSGTYRQIESNYQRQCQALKPPGYRGR